MDKDQLLKYLLIAVGGYLVWVYVIQPMMGQQTAASTGGQLPIVPQSPVQTGTQTAASAPQAPAVTAAQLQSMAKVVLLNADQWAYYYQQIPGHTISPQQMETILTKLSLTDATRATSITAQQFVSALNATGLSGIVPSWQSSGGPSFSNFIPAGASFAGGFSGSNRGFRSAPKAWIQ